MGTATVNSENVRGSQGNPYFNSNPKILHKGQLSDAFKNLLQEKLRICLCHAHFPPQHPPWFQSTDSRAEGRSLAFSQVYNKHTCKMSLNLTDFDQVNAQYALLSQSLT